ncbi:MAG: GNAT family N-acetyltransferase [Oscillospiraceae bacterium]|jgi:RimJ/RimL family protein N-acetyltransferase|nr:GNAT family N-acetyltransferase [Oscillospiraceae bacterium]
MTHYRKLEGGRVYLSPVHPDDAEPFIRWLSNPETAQYLQVFPKNLTITDERKWIAELGSAPTFAIVTLENDELIGNCSLIGVDGVNSTAELGIFIGEPQFLGKGYGAEAIRLLLGYGFNTLNLHSITLRVHGDNARAQRCYEKCGFREFGTRRESAFKHGRYFDVIYMDILRGDFENAGA